MVQQPAAAVAGLAVSDGLVHGHDLRTDFYREPLRVDATGRNLFG